MNKKGMSLIEVIVALGIIALVSVSFLSVFTNGFALIGKSNKLQLDQMDARKYVEGIVGDSSDYTKISDNISFEVSNVSFKAERVEITTKEGITYAYYQGN